MAKYLFLDQASARHPQVMSALDDPNARVVISDAYLAEFSRWVPDRISQHFQRLAQLRDRVYLAAAAGSCIQREIKSLTRTNQGHVIHSQGTVWIRQALADPVALAQMNTEAELKKIVHEDRYSDPATCSNYIGIVRTFETAMARANFRPVAHDAPITDDELEGIIKLARLSVYRYVLGYGHSAVAAKKFALGDSYLFREASSRFCRAVDWAQAHGIQDQSKQQLYSENMDLEYVSLATYFDDFLVYEKRSRRNIENVRRLLKMSPSIRMMREATVTGIAGVA